MEMKESIGQAEGEEADEVDVDDDDDGGKCKNVKRVIMVLRTSVVPRAARHAISLARSSSSQTQGVHRRRGLHLARGEAGRDVDTAPHRRGAGVGEVRYLQESFAEDAVWAAA